MSTTMHAHIEVKKNGKWLHFAAPTVQTNYILFAAINGEQIEDLRHPERITPQASIKGLPDDLSEVTKFCHEQDSESYYLHGEGALTAEDLENLQEHLWEINEYDPKAKWDLDTEIFRTYINGNAICAHQGWDDVRIVFWYDH